MAAAHSGLLVSDEGADPALRELAAALGVASEYWDWQGRRVEVARSTIVAVLAGLGVDGSTPERAVTALAEHRAAVWRRMLPPCLVVRSGTTPWFWVHVPDGASVEAWVELEDGAVRTDVVQQDRWVPPAVVDGAAVGEATFALPADLPLGWHTLHARSGERSARCPLVVTPAFLGLPTSLADRRAWGFTVQLYSVRSARSWGIGDLTDLGDLAGWSGHELGADFVLVNPLHAASPIAPMEPSPYLPVSRRFANPLYLRVEAVPEFAYLEATDRATADQLAAPVRATNGSTQLLDRDASWTAKRLALELVHRVPRTPGRQAAYQAFLEREGQGLLDFATWSVLVEEHGVDWTGWPVDLQDVRGEAAAEVRHRLADRVDFHCWLQWLLDEQLAEAQRVARSAGMRFGVVHDLAVGVHPQGADAWTLREALAERITVGAPPDAFNQQGQDWSQPPWRPDRLAALGYRPYRDMLRTVLRHAGGLRVDHVLGLFRLWWVPEGMPPSAGTYVRYDHEAMVGILALEAHRAGAFVVGEDLGTVEPWVRDYLHDRGVLGTSVLWFERDWDRDLPIRPERWRPLCLATVTTHDLPPSAGYLAGEHIRLRSELGLLTRPVEEVAAQDAAEQESWRALLSELGLLRPGADVRETVEALHRFVARTPAQLVGVALPDAVGDVRAQNQPGTHHEYPNWRLPLSGPDGRPVLLEQLAASPRVRSLARAATPG